MHRVATESRQHLLLLRPLALLRGHRFFATTTLIFSRSKHSKLAVYVKMLLACICFLVTVDRKDLCLIICLSFLGKGNTVVGLATWQKRENLLFAFVFASSSHVRLRVCVMNVRDEVSDFSYLLCCMYALLVYSTYCYRTKRSLF